MPGMRILRHIYAPYVIVLVAVLAAASAYTYHSLRTVQLETARTGLEAQAYLVADSLTADFFRRNTEALTARSQELASLTGLRITVILPDGRVLADSEASPEQLDNHGDRPDVLQALAGRTGVFTAPASHPGGRQLYVSIPILKAGVSEFEPRPVEGVVRLTASLIAVDRVVATVYVQIFLGLLAIAAAAVLAGFVVSRRISRPLGLMTEAVDHYSRGDLLPNRLALPQSEELGGLAAAMNRMATQLDQRIQTIVQQHHEIEAVLSSMVEGVLAVDRDERVINLNQAGAQLLGLSGKGVIGRSIQEVARNTELQRLIGRTLAEDAPVEGEFVLYDAQERFIQVHGARLRDAQGRNIGGLVVLHDVTRLRLLESARRDFVANVSHELRTPITSIKGYAETLLDGALRDPEAAERFVEIIAHHSSRLAAIIEDLLSLSRFEQDGGSLEMSRESVQVRELLDSAAQLCAKSAEAKSIRIEVECAPDLVAVINPPLMEQAIKNLVENAVKYSEPHTEVRVAAASEAAGVHIEVRDHGCGIAQEHLPRIFERFYRVDVARSRKEGGTGLGLAIVKHIVRVHGGQTTVESAPGKGSTFSIRLPLL